MKLKTVELDGKTYAEVQDGKPVFTGDDGKDIAFDAVGTRDTITRLNGEAKGHRERAEKAEASLKAFEGISDPAAARKALETVSNLDQKRLIDAGEVDKVKAEVAKGYELKLSESDARAKALEDQLYAEKIGGSFARSPLIVGDKAKFAIPADFVQARFGQHFKIEDGKIVATDVAGNRIYSRSKPGEYADFDEALDVLVESYPQKESILRGTGAQGSGARDNPGGGAGKSMKASDFAALGPKDQAAKMAEGYTLTE